MASRDVAPTTVSSIALPGSVVELRKSQDLHEARETGCQDDPQWIDLRKQQRRQTSKRDHDRHDTVQAVMGEWEGGRQQESSLATTTEPVMPRIRRL
jgi:hypothetical protein